MRRLISRAAAGRLDGYPTVLSSLLLARGVDTPEKAQAFLHPHISQLHDPFLMQNMPEACALIRAAIAAGQSVVIYGDYDCDGVCASVILQEALAALGCTADVYIPHRKEEGYGLNEAAVRRLAERHQLLITVDCGITAVSEVALARALGMKVIVTDHHTVPAELPAANAVLHPQLGNYPCPSLCGAGVAYKLACALLGEPLLPSLELCALATIADMVPLLGENRTLAALGLAAMPVSDRPGLRALLSVAGLHSGDPVSGQQAAFLLAPRVNACGRLESASLALELFTTRDALRAMVLAEQADGLNSRRKNLENRILEEADAQVRQMDLCTHRAIVVRGEGWESGVVGLAAGRLAERYGYPTVALSEQDGICVGSARSACGVDLYRALADCGDLFLRFGGHRQAAGLTLKADCVEALRERLSAAVETQLAGQTLAPETVYDGTLTLPQITLELIEQLQLLEPYGMGNPAPVFLLEDVDVLSARAVGADRSHLKLTLSQDGALTDAIAFRMGHLAADLNGACSLAVSPVANTFNGRTTAECRIEAVAALPARFRRTPDEESLAILQEFERFCRIYPISTDAEAAAVLPAPQGSQGTLYLCRTAETAARVAALYPQLDVLPEGGGADPRAYHALWLCGSAACRGPYRQVVLCDGALCPQELSALQALYPAARLTVLPQSGALRERLSTLRFSVEELRAFYVRLRGGARADLAGPRTAAMTRVLQSLSLLSESLQLLPARKCDPTTDPLYQLLQGSEA